MRRGRRRRRRRRRSRKRRRRKRRRLNVGRMLVLKTPPASVRISFHSLMSAMVPPLGPATVCFTSVKRRSSPHTLSWCSASRSVTSPCA
jgi:hypothetical protein